jgi:hypothetical protein
MTCSAMSIGVAVGPDELEIAAEFFELFKTPWEPAVPGRRYPVVLSTAGSLRNLDAEVFLIYGSERDPDRDGPLAARQTVGPVDLTWRGAPLPIYGRIATFDANPAAIDLTSGRQVAGYIYRSADDVRCRVGYDLFSEIRHLLREGQPASQALTPTLDLHIALLRQLLWQCEVPFTEVLPRPHGYDFICCLTHDVDFFGVRHHLFDRTFAGFVARASVGSWLDFVRGRRSWADVVRNFKALVTLPLVFLGLARDFWRPFEDYRRVEEPARSTFFLVPFKDRPGVAPEGGTDTRRAVKYELDEISEEVKEAARRGSEIAVHGLDAWHNCQAGSAEKHRLISITNQPSAGVRMHWLYFSPDAPRQLEAAGFAYDATCGYNETIGYRAGTSQVFRLPGTQRLLELPLAIMDSALLAHDRTPLAPEDALALCRRIVGQARTHGGTVVINWHCRSLAPERLWGAPYQELLAEVAKGDRAWFARAGAAVDWYRWRRSITFSENSSPSGGHLRVSAPWSNQPAGVLRTYRRGPTGAESYDVAFDGSTPVDVDIQSRVLSL